MHVFHRVQVHAFHQQTIHKQCLIDSADHHRFLHGLIISADEVVVQILIQVEHLFHHGHGLINIQLIHIESVLRQGQAAVPQQLGAVNHGMHEQVMAKTKVHFIPAKNPIHRQILAVLHHMLVLNAHLVIHVIANQGVDFFPGVRHLLQPCQHPAEAILIHPVVRVHHLEVLAGCMGEAAHHRIPMAAILLVNGTNNTGIPLLKIIGNFCRPILGAVIHNENLHILAAGKQGFHGMMQIVLGIVAGNRNRQ